MALLPNITVRRVAGSGSALTYTNASTSDTLHVQNATLLHVRNTSGASRSFTIPAGQFAQVQPAGSRGVTVPDITFTVANGVTRVVPILRQYADADGLATIQVSNASGVSYAVIQ